MNRVIKVLAVVTVLAAGAGWHYQDRLRAARDALWPPATAPTAAAAPDVLYTWVDAKGVTHYGQQSGKGRRVTYDGSAITPLAKPDPGPLDRLRQAAGEEEAAGSGNAILDLRGELQENARKMQAAKAAQSDF